MTLAETMHRPTPEQIARAFLTPSPDTRQATLDHLAGGRRRWLESRSGRIAASEAGSGPQVLLVHGWEGRASDMSAFAAPLIEAGCKVISIDLPAHGESDGVQTSIPASALALVDAQRQLGELHAVIAHSVGSAVAVEAMGHGLQVSRAALLAAPARYVDYAIGFAMQAGLPRDDIEAMIASLAQLGVDVRAVSMPERARQLHRPALFVHSADDRVVSIRDARASVQAWRGARLIEVADLGHRRLLQDANVVRAVTSFVAAFDGASPEEQS